MKIYFSISLLLSTLMLNFLFLAGCESDFISGPEEDFKQISSLEKPSQLRISGVGPTSLTVSWKASKNAISYRLYAATDSLFYNILTGFPISEIQDTTYRLNKGIFPNKKIFLKLVAENLRNEKSFFSETISAKTPNADALMYYTSNPFPIVRSISNNSDGEIQWLGFNFQYYLGFGEKILSLTTDAEIMILNTFDKLFGVSAANGDFLWRVSVSGIISMPLLTKTQIVVTAADGNLYAFDKKNGTLLWQFNTNTPAMASPTALNNTIFVGNDEGTFFAIDSQTGQQKWQYQASGSIRTNPCSYKENIIFGTSEGLLYALNAQTGTVVWEFKTKKIVGSPAIAEGNVHFATEDGQLFALNALTGAKIWLHQSFVGIEGSPNVANNKIAFYGKNHLLNILDGKTGNLLIQKNIEQAPTNGITITKFGKIYIPGLGIAQNEIWIVNAEDGDIKKIILDKQGRGQVYTPIVVQAGDNTFAYPTESGN